MKLGVVSDTHDRAQNVERILSRFAEAQVEAVVHTGDFTLPQTLEMFARLEIPVYGVLGNNDHDREGLLGVASRAGMHLGEHSLELDLGGRRVCVVHDPEDVDLAELGSREGGPELVLHGHTHRYRWERVGRVWVFNPGECAGFVEGLGAVGVIDVPSLGCVTLKV